MKFNKPAISIADQIQLLESRDLLTEDKENAFHFLSNIKFCCNYVVFGCLYYLLQTISPHNQLKVHFKELLHKNTNVYSVAIGFPADWEEEPHWQYQNGKK